MNEQPRAHHPYSPSKLQALEVCPSFEGRDEVNLAATTGTKQHSVVETGVDNPDLTDEQMIAAAECVLFVAGQRALLEEERARHVAAEFQAFDLTSQQAENMYAPVEELTEQYLPVDDEFVDVGPADSFIGTTAGYVDKVLLSWDKSKAVLIDYKFGKWAVEKAENNLQAIAYCLGVFHKYPTVNTVDFYFKQPALDNICHARFTREQVPALLLRVKTVVARAKSARAAGDYATANPTIPGCLFCANLGKCPKVADFALRTSRKYSPVDVPADITPTGLHSPENSKLRLRLAALMEVWSSAVKKLENDRVLRGDSPVPEGYRLESRQTRKIADEKLFKQIALSFLTEAEFAATLEIQFGKVEKQISAKQPRGQKSAAVEQFAARLESEGAVKLSAPFAFLKVDNDSAK